MTVRLSDLSYLQRISKGDRSVIARFIGAYLDSAPALYATLLRSAQASDVRGVAMAAHDLRPHAHYMGAQQVLELLLAIDKAARAETPVVRTELVTELMALVPVLDLELREAINAALS